MISITLNDIQQQLNLIVLDFKNTNLCSHSFLSASEQISLIKCLFLHSEQFNEIEKLCDLSRSEIETAFRS